jgi:branched-chain amino acid aminotransferase
MKADRMPEEAHIMDELDAAQTMPPLSEAFEATDRITLGHGVFDTLLVRDGSPVHGPAHMDRLIRHARAFGMNPPVTREGLLTRVKERITQARATTGLWRLRTVLSAGEGPPGLAFSPDGPVTLAMTLAPAHDPTHLPPLTLTVARGVRRNDRSPLSRIKSTNYGENILAAAEARAAGFTDAVLLNTQGRVACASAANLFAFLADGSLATPPVEEGAMDGIVRGLLLEQGAVERPLTLENLESARGLYTTNSLTGLRPALSLSGRSLATPLDIATRFPLS